MLYHPSLYVGAMQGRNKRQMSKLLNLRELFTLEEAAKFVTDLLGESVVLTDICQLALDGHLTISVRLINQAYALAGRCTLMGNERSSDISSKTDTSKWIAFDEKVQVIGGVWDLPMIGMESSCVLKQFQNSSSQPAFDGGDTNGVFLAQGDQVYKLQTVLKPLPGDKKKHSFLAMIFPPLCYEGITLMDLIFSRDHEIKEMIFKAEKAESAAALERFKSQPSLDYVFEDSHELGEYEHQLVIKKTELLRFVESQSEDGLGKQTEDKSKKPKVEKTLHSRERNTLLVLIGALCKQLKIDPGARGVTSSVKLMTEQIGAPVSDDSIRNILNQVDEAIEKRQK